MSYEPSHRRPPRQERWPNATPGEGWPAYQQGDGGPRWESAAFAGSRNGHVSDGYASNGYASDGYRDASNGYGDAWGGGGAAGYGDSARGYWAARNGYGGATTAYPAAGDGYTDGFDGAAGGGGYDGTQDYYEAPNGWDGYTQPGQEFTGPADYPEYPSFDPAASSVLVAPDTIGEWWRRPDPGEGPSRGLVVGAVTGLLAAAVAIGVATLAAAFVRPQASPVSAVGGVFIDRIPAALRNHLMAHFGAHAETLLLLGAVGFIAVVSGCLARRNTSMGVAVLAAFGLLGAFVAITRPESRASDVIPSAIGGLAGIVALLWLARASAPAPRVASPGPGYGGGRRRAR
jgi:hypothetical protein